MKTSRNEPALHSEIRAALLGLEGTLQGDGAPPELLLVPLARAGDALRADIDLPPRLRTWLRALPAPELGAALDVQRGEIGEWHVPARFSLEDHMLSFTLRRRDEAESVRMAAASAALSSRTVPASIPGFKELGEALINFDHELAGTVSRQSAEAMLGTRAALQEPRGWTSRLPDDAERAAPSDMPGLDLDELASQPMSDEAVEAWISEGRLNRLVEQKAANDSEFRAELGELIDQLREDRQQVGLVARRWARPNTHAPIEYPVRPAIAAVAGAGGDPAAVSRTDTDLGRLSPVPARARLVCTVQYAILTVYAARDLIRSVRFADREITAPDADGAWRIQIPLEDAPVDLRVVSAAGEEFTAKLVIAPAPVEEEQ